ncbi:TIGR01777 family oxidoreductase [Gordonia sp. (in: high G+C Gram-positive bacteria)]|uniref:TIGR01777 family oxidoreductase n=1 Tax=unclassified Gordonia (in: high G+C Gram-positive bacteria) TaxID=2657482 RepID=UPI0026151975|nr:TIGR01777 family oxidoreductase [Gordonia sp. (in: high G+C Gram-positive bacteria)]
MGIMHTSTVDAPCEEVFAWHSRPGALRRLLPPWQPMSAISESPSLADGQAILGLPGGLRWRAQHRADGYDPPHRFVDERISDSARDLPTMLSGPWRHEHEFAAQPGGQTRMTDRVHTAVPAAALRSTFRFRHRQVSDDLSRHRHAQAAGLTPMTIAVTGASGMVGQQFTAFLTTGGHRVIRLVRRPTDAPDERTWNPECPDADLLTGVDAVVHLAGAPIAGRFTPAHKAQIRDSRIGPTRRLAAVAAGDAAGPSIFVSASAIGFYGHERPGETLTETDPAGDDFLADVVRDWEDATSPAVAAGLRCVQVRTGIVMSPLGGVLRLQRPLFASGLGGPLGNGRQTMSWIDLDDLIDIYHRALYDDRLAGPVNACSPEPVTGSEYANTLGRVLHRPALLPVPALGPSLILGQQGARELALADQRVQPWVLLHADHRFRRPALRESLRHQLGKA